MIGRGKNTRTKQQHLSVILEKHMGIVRTIMRKHSWAKERYLYIDIYSGSGEYVCERKLIQGSPIVAIKTASKIGLKMQYWFNDNDAGNIDRLKGNLKEFDIMPELVRFLVFEDEDFFQQLKTKTVEKQYGLLYLDPNGHPDFDGVQEFFGKEGKERRGHYVDVLFNFPATALKRCLGNSTSGFDKYTDRIVDRMVKINKKYWLIKEPYESDRDQFTFLLGTNMTDFPKFEKIGMHSVTSTRGLELLKLFTYSKEEREVLDRDGWYKTYDEYLAHPIWKIIKCEKLASARNGRCSECRARFATQCHHLEGKYPDWGTFDRFKGEIGDVKETLLAVCKPCHAAIHGKEK